MVPRIIKQRLLNHKEASEYLNISERKLEYLVAAGNIKQTRLVGTRKRLYDVFDLDRFIDLSKAA